MPGRLLSVLLTALFCIGLISSSAFAGDDWRPVDPALLGMKTPQVEPDADAEAIFWEVRIADEDIRGDMRSVRTHYIRIKIFNERGKESQSRIDIPYYGKTQISDIVGRTIKPDGSIVELKKDAIFERTIVKASGVKIKAKSFAMPAVEPGAIIEYRYKEGRDDRLSFYDRYQFQRDIPIELVKYYIKPSKFEGLNLPSGFGMSMRMFHAQFSPFQKEKDGTMSTSLQNVPAFHEEPQMPPEDQVRMWMLIYYTLDQHQTPEQFWPKYGREQYNEYKSKTKVNDDVRKATATIIGDATTPEQKLERIYDFCRVNIKNISADSSELTGVDRARLKPNESPADTLKRNMGTGADIDFLFAALATAAGFDTRVAHVGNRGDIFFDKAFADEYMLRDYNIAVKVNNEWRFFEPASTYVPFGMLPWQMEQQPALICDNKDSMFVGTPLSPPSKSVEKRNANLTLSADGTLEGDVTIEYTGHLGVVKKEENDGDSPQQREETLRDKMKARLSTAEVSEIKIENATDPNKPFTYRFHVRVPGYAERTGKRLFLQPAFFEKGIPALFTASSRRHEIYFHFPWTEDDSVTINLPPGFALDQGDAPGSFKVNETAQYDVKMQIVGKNEQFIYKRTWMFNGIDFPPDTYDKVKRLFEIVHQSDNHTVTFKQQTAAQ